jgi:hypothetical protein
VTLLTQPCPRYNVLEVCSGVAIYDCEHLITTITATKTIPTKPRHPRQPKTSAHAICPRHLPFTHHSAIPNPTESPIPSLPPALPSPSYVPIPSVTKPTLHIPLPYKTNHAPHQPHPSHQLTSHQSTSHHTNGLKRLEIRIPKNQRNNPPLPRAAPSQPKRSSSPSRPHASPGERR